MHTFHLFLIMRENLYKFKKNISPCAFGYGYFVKNQAAGYNTH